MPLYEYECSACHRRTEKIQKFSDAELTICPHCGGPLERTITAPALNFAGGGWYKDLYSSTAKPSGDSSAAAPAAAASTDSAPAAAPAAPTAAAAPAPPAASNTSKT